MFISRSLQNHGLNQSQLTRITDIPVGTIQLLIDGWYEQMFFSSYGCSFNINEIGGFREQLYFDALGIYVILRLVHP